MQILYECLIGIVLLPLVLPWTYIVRHYVRAEGAPWSGVAALRPGR